MSEVKTERFVCVVPLGERTPTDSGGSLLGDWLEASQEGQTFKLSPIERHRARHTVPNRS